MKETATILAVGGVVAIGIGLLVLSGFTGQAVDSELLKQLTSGLIGFAGGAGVTYAVTKNAE